MSKIVGAPPGYVGHDESGNLTERIRHRPYAVVLFDEIEKAHPEVFNILLQVLDNGHLTDAKGRKVNFKNTVIILTSNIGAEYIDRMTKIGFSVATTSDSSYEDAKVKVMASLKDYFRPEFLNRLDEILLFNILSRSAVEDIVRIQIGLVRERLASKNIEFSVSPEVLAFLAKEGYNPQYGARPLKRLIQGKILTKIASLMVEQNVMEGGAVSVTLTEGGEFDFTITKKKGAKRRGTPSSLKVGKRVLT